MSTGTDQPDKKPARRDPGDLGGEAVCWLPRVCPDCGRLADEEPPTRCPRCGAEITVP